MNVNRESPSFLRKVPIPNKYSVDSSGCWNWTGYKSNLGYGFYYSSGARWNAHRFFYLKLVGPIKKGLNIDHLCRNRGCVNPEHLEAVTPGENNRRGLSIPALNGRKVLCKRGHPLSGDNLVIYYRDGRKGRYCRKCFSIRYMDRAVKYKLFKTHNVKYSKKCFGATRSSLLLVSDKQEEINCRICLFRLKP